MKLILLLYFRRNREQSDETESINLAGRSELQSPRMPYETEEEIKEAQELRSELYDSFDSVNVYPNGLYEVRIVAENTQTQQ